jgi:hypothetical protein
MIADALKHLLDALKLSPKYLVAIFAVLAFLLFGPGTWQRALGVQSVAEDYRAALGVGLLACAALMGVELLRLVFSKVGDFRARRNHKARVAKRLYALTEDEKQILRFYIAHQTRSNSLRLDDGVVNGLVRAGILYRAGLGGYFEFPHGITQTAWDMLNEEQWLLDGTTNTYRTDARW